MALTDTWLRAKVGKSGDRVREKADRDGLSVRLSPKGKITFQIRYRYDGKPKRLDLESYPRSSLKAARGENERLRAELEKGRDPRVVLQLEKQAIIEADSLQDLFAQWYESYCKKNKKGHDQIKRSFEIHVFPKLGRLPAAEVTLHEWLSVLEALAGSRAGIADRVLTNAKQMYKWAVRRQVLPVNPLADINAAEDLQVKSGVDRRSLDDVEIKQVWEAVELSRMSQKNKLFVKLCLFFACRNGELRLSEISHFDLDKMVWMVPPENHKLGDKTGEPLLRPIIPEVKPLIEEAIKLSGSRKYLFSNSGSSEPMGTSAPLSLPSNIMQWLRKNRQVEMKHWSMHSLRKTARTNFSTLAQPHVAEIILGHALPGEWRTYDHHHYLDEQSEVYIKWWGRLMDIVR